MKKNILILNSYLNISPLRDFFLRLKSNDFSLYFLNGDQNTLKVLNQDGFNCKKFKLYYPNNFFLFSFFLLTIPFKLFVVFFVLLFFKTKKNTKILFCFSLPEKIFFTPVAKLLKMQVLWFEFPEEKRNKYNFLYKTISKSAKIIVLNDFLKKDLRKKALGKIFYLPPGIDLSRYKNQVNIFNTLAQKERREAGKKFFTIGAIYNQNNTKYLENLLKAGKILFNVIPNIQILVIGNEEDKTKLEWMTKKMGIDSFVWFIKKKRFFNFQNIDLFFIGFDNFSLLDFIFFLQVATSALPIIAPAESRIEEIVKNSENGFLIEDIDSEKIVTIVSKIKQNKKFRYNLGEKSKDLIDKNFKIDRMMEYFFKEIL